MPLEFEITDETGAPVSDISGVALEKKATRRLNLPATAACKVPAEFLPADLDGLRLKVRNNGSIFFNGLLWDCGDDGDENSIHTELTAVDPRIWLQSRPARDADGDFSKPSFMQDFTTGPAILEEILTNSIAEDGDLGIALGTFAGGGADLSGAPVDWPMSIAEIANLLVSTGECDLVLDPLDTTDGNMVEANAYNGDYGNDLTGSVSLDYQTGAFNVRRIRRQWSMASICNKLWYYLGPRKMTSSDPPGDQHWAGNVTGDHPDLDALSPLGDLSTEISASRSTFGVWMQIRIFDGEDASSVLPLFLRLWQIESLLRLKPRELVHVTPVRGMAPAFDIGDLIELNAGAKLRGGFTGAVQRVYGYSLGESDDGVLEVSEILTSADQEAA